MSVDPPAQVLIGWKEYVEFPDWDLRRVRAKVDTGARTSALDTQRYELKQMPDGTLHATLLLRVRSSRSRPRMVEVPVLGFVEVRSSNGAHEKRPLIETTIALGGIVKRVRFTLASRTTMRFRVLLGRTALTPEFLVDVSQQYLQHRG
jgi:hypothetical protein